MPPRMAWEVTGHWYWLPETCANVESMELIRSVRACARSAVLGSGIPAEDAFCSSSVRVISWFIHRVTKFDE